MERPSEPIPSVSLPQAPGDAAVVAEDSGSRLSLSLVELYKGIYGRGPATVRTLFSEDLVVAVMHTVLTPGERTLVAGGKLAEVEQMRLRTAEVAKPRLVPLVEEALGANVAASVTGIGVIDDVATETFLLEPGAGPAPGD